MNGWKTMHQPLSNSEAFVLEEAMRYAGAALVLAFMALPALAHGQQADQARPTNPAARLLGMRQELSLTADQVRRIEEVDRRVTQQGQALRQRLEELRGVPAGEPLRLRDMTDEQRARLQANRAEMAPVMMQLRALHAQAVADLTDVLTAEQRQRVAGRMFMGPAQGRGPGAGAARGPGRGPAWGPGQGRAWGPGQGPAWGPRHGPAWGPGAAWRGQRGGWDRGWWGPRWREEN
jgi:Spy/CpxP family protein refolding chaperone